MQKPSTVYNYKKLQLLPLLLLVCICAFPVADLYAKLFLGSFSVSRSSFKSYLFFLLLFVIWHFWERDSAGVLRSTCARKWLIVLLTILLLLPVFELVFLYIEFEVPVFSLRGFYDFGDLSNSSLYHNHIGKVAIGNITRFFSDEDFRHTYDSGMAYLGFLPVPVLILHTLLGVAFLCLLLANLPRQSSISPGWSLISIVVTFTMLKNTFDGGLFFHETAIAYPVYCYIQLCPAERFRKYLPHLICCCLALIVASLAAATLNGISLTHSILTVSVLLSLYPVLYFTDRLASSSSGVRALIPLTLYFTTYYFLTVTMMWISTFPAHGIKYAFSRLSADQKFFLVLKNPIQSNSNIFKILEVQKSPSQYLYVLESRKNMRILDLAAIGLNSNFYEVTLPGKNCRVSEPYSQKYMIHYDGSRQLIDGSFHGILSWKVDRVTNRDYKVVVTYRGCTPEPVSWLIAILSSRGIMPSMIAYEDEA